MPLLGEHNVRNALAAIAVGVDLGLDIETLRQGLAAFKGVKRRLEVVGEARGVTVYDDFAHHPTAVDETLARGPPRGAGPAHLGDLRAALRFVVPARVPGRLRARVCRRRRSGDRVGVPLEPAARGAPVGRPARRRSRAPERARAAPADVDAIVETVAGEARDGDLIVVMSNGGFGGIHRKLLEALAGGTKVPPLRTHL